MDPFSLYMDAVTRLLDQHPAWPAGQAAMVALAELHPELADLVVGTDLDPHDDDRRISALNQWLLQQLPRHGALKQVSGHVSGTLHGGVNL